MQTRPLSMPILPQTSTFAANTSQKHQQSPSASSSTPSLSQTRTERTAITDYRHRNPRIGANASGGRTVCADFRKQHTLETGHTCPGAPYHERFSKAHPTFQCLGEFATAPGCIVRKPHPPVRRCDAETRFVWSRAAQARTALSGRPLRRPIPPDCVHAP